MRSTFIAERAEEDGLAVRAAAGGRAGERELTFPVRGDADTVVHAIGKLAVGGERRPRVGDWLSVENQSSANSGE